MRDKSYNDSKPFIMSLFMLNVDCFSDTMKFEMRDILKKTNKSKIGFEMYKFLNFFFILVNKDLNGK